MRDCYESRNSGDAEVRGRMSGVRCSAIIATRVIPTVVMNRAIIRSLQDFDEDDEIPVISGRGEGIMEEAPATGSGSARRNEDIALDLMKFVAMTTGYGRTTSTGVGFSGSGSAAKPEDYADKLLELYGRCLGAVGGKK